MRNRLTRIMWPCSAWIVLLLLLSPVTHGEESPTTRTDAVSPTSPTLALSVSLAADTYAWGEAIVAETVLTNTGKTVFTYSYSSIVDPYGIYRISIHDAAGRLTDVTACWHTTYWAKFRSYRQERERRQKNPLKPGELYVPLGYPGGGGSVRERWYRPGESKQCQFLLNELFDLSTPGTYNLEISFSLSFDYGDCPIYRSKASFSIVAPNAPSAIPIADDATRPLSLAIQATSQTRMAPIALSVRADVRALATKRRAAPPGDFLAGEIVVADARGKKASLTRYGRDLLARKEGPFSPSFWSSAAAGSAPLWLNRIYDMSIPGRYQVWLRSTLAGGDGAAPQEYYSERQDLNAK